MKAILILFTLLFLTNNISSLNNNLNCIEIKFERGIEIRYYVLKVGESSKIQSIKVDGIEYKLYKSKEDAVNSVKLAEFKKDYTIVYVLSSEKKENEIISIED